VSYRAAPPRVGSASVERPRYFYQIGEVSSELLT